MKPLTAILAVAVFCLSTFAVVDDASAKYGGLYVSGGETAQALSTTAAKMTGFAAVAESGADDGDQSVVATLADDTVTLLGGGTYLVSFDITALVGTADIQVAFTLRNGTTAITGATCGLEAEAADVPTNASMTWIYRPTADAVLSVYTASESGTPNLTPVDAQLSVVRID